MPRSRGVYTLRGGKHCWDIIYNPANSGDPSPITPIPSCANHTQPHPNALNASRATAAIEARSKGDSLLKIIAILQNDLVLCSMYWSLPATFGAHRIGDRHPCSCEFECDLAVAEARCAHRRSNRWIGDHHGPLTYCKISLSGDLRSQRVPFEQDGRHFWLFGILFGCFFTLFHRCIQYLQNVFHPS